MVSMSLGLAVFFAAATLNSVSHRSNPGSVKVSSSKSPYTNSQPRFFSGWILDCWRTKHVTLVPLAISFLVRRVPINPVAPVINAWVIFKEHLVLTKQAMIGGAVVAAPKILRYYCFDDAGDAICFL